MLLLGLLLQGILLICSSRIFDTLPFLDDARTFERNSRHHRLATDWRISDADPDISATGTHVGLVEPPTGARYDQLIEASIS
jgi:hypothetical protein